jgi:hypothetical protein
VTEPGKLTKSGRPWSVLFTIITFN